MIRDRSKGEAMDPKWAERLAAALARLDAIARRLGDATRPPTAQGSQAGRDLALPHARFILIGASRSLDVALDHVQAWRLIARGGHIPVYAYMTLLRTAIEMTATARWLVDPTCTGPERVERAIALQIDDYEQRARWETSIHAPQPPAGQGKSGAARLAELRAARDAAGIGIRGRPSVTELTSRYGAPASTDGRWLFQLASAFAHGKEWAMHAMTLGPVVSIGPGTNQGAIQASDRVVVGSSEIAIALIDKAVEEFAAYLAENPPTASGFA